MPSVVASLSLPIVALVGDQWRRRALVGAGGLLFAAALAATAASSNFRSLFAATLVLVLASSVFVSLTQATLVDVSPDAATSTMARWVLVGWVAVVLGPLVLSGVVFAGGSWRTAFVGLAALAFVATTMVNRVPVAPPERSQPLRALALNALRSLKRREVRSPLVILQFSELLTDVFYAFLALYFVDVLGRSPMLAALALTLWSAASLLGSACLIRLLRRLDATRYLRASAWFSVFAYPVFLLAPSDLARFVLIAALGFSTAGWYTVTKAQLFQELPGASGSAIALYELTSLVGWLFPILVGAVAAASGLEVAMWSLLVGPLVLIVVSRRDPNAEVFVGGAR